MPAQHPTGRTTRLRRQTDFRAVARHGVRAESSSLRIEMMRWRHPTRPSMFAVRVSRKFGKAVQRNLFKRRVREALRMLYPQHSQGYAIIVGPARHKAQPTYRAIFDELTALIEQGKAQLALRPPARGPSLRQREIPPRTQRTSASLPTLTA